MGFTFLKPLLTSKIPFQIHSIYRNTGASYDKAKTEFADRFMSNQHVQQAASNAASAVISSQLSGGGSNGSGPRY